MKQSLKNIKIKSRSIKKYTYGDVVKPNYLISGLSGAASGAAAGSAIVPPWGTIAGAAVGGAMSLYGSKKGYNEAVKSAKLAEGNDLTRAYEENKYGKINKDLAGLSFKMGGKVKSRRISKACKSKK